LYTAVAEPGNLLDTLFDYAWVVWESYGAEATKRQ
jgi:hypothetical protein